MKEKSIFLRLPAALLLLALAAPSPAGAVDPDDRDGDATVDGLDNCLEHANASQRDTDRDGFGNACDPDFDQNGIVDRRDASAQAQQFSSEPRGRSKSRPRGRAEVMRLRDFDLNEDGVVDNLDLRVTQSFFGRPPGPRLDRDRDGRADVEDPCPVTRPGLSQLLPGCAAVDLIEAPETVVAPLRDGIVALEASLRAHRRMDEANREIAAAIALVGEAPPLLRAGDPCGGAERLRGAQSAMVAAAARAKEAAHEAYAALPRRETEEEPEEELVAYHLHHLSHLVAEASGAVASMGDAVGQVCSAAHPLTAARGTVARILDSPGRLELVDGRSYSLAQPLAKEGFLGPGVEVELEGFDFAEGSGFVTSITSQIEPSTLLGPDCLKLRFAPVQRSAPLFPGPYVLHRPEGYLMGDRYRVEKGMGFAAELVPACEVPPLTFLSLEVTLVYNQGNWVTLATHLEAGEAPVPLPFITDPATWSDPRLHVRALRRTWVGDELVSNNQPWP